jgi:hypothetical protein
MRLSDVSREVRRVAVGPTREAAAAAFGRDHDDLFLTSYGELADEVDLNHIISLDLAAGEGLWASLDMACHQLHAAPQFSLRVQYTPEDAASLREVLDRNAVVISNVEGGDGRLVLTLGAAELSESHNQVVLSALDAAASALSGPRDTGAQPSPDKATENARPANLNGALGPASAPIRRGGKRRSGRPQPPLLRAFRTLNRLRGSRRKRAMSVIALTVLVVALLAAGLSANRLGPVAGVLIALLLILVLAASGVSLVTSLLLARQVHAQTGRIERMVLRHRALLDNRTTSIAQEVRTLAKGRERLPFVLDLLEAMAVANSTSAARITDGIESLGSDAERLHLDTQRQFHALLQLHQLLDLRDGAPAMGGGGTSADFNLLVLRELLSNRPRIVVECGSGTSTLLLALAARQYDLPTRVIALDHLEGRKAATERALREHGVAAFAEVRLAPLSRISVPAPANHWYAEESLHDIQDVGLLVVGKPPDGLGEWARYPAVPLLLDRLSEHCVVVIDDLIRRDNLEALQSWSALLPGFELEHLDTLQRHAGVLRR